jgi:hypothetical protein
MTSIVGLEALQVAAAELLLISPPAGVELFRLLGSPPGRNR